MIPLTRPTLPAYESIQDKFKEVFQSGMLTESKFVKEFEQQCAEFLQVKHVIAVSSGTCALMLAMKCLNLKGEVILPSFTFTSDGHSLLWNNLDPVFVDVNPLTYNLDPVQIEKAITSNTCAILPTHVFGSPCDIEAIEKIAEKYNLKIIYDAAHAFGAKHNEESIAKFGDVTVYSLTPTKVLPIGEGGLLATNDDALAAKLKLSKFNGDSFNREEEFLGLSARLSEFHAIVGIEALKVFPEAIRQRIEKVKLYKQKLVNISGIKFQEIMDGHESVYKDLAVVIDELVFGASRDALLEELKKNDIQTKVYFDPPLHRKQVYKQYHDLVLPSTYYLSNNIIDLPLSSHMPNEDIDKVCSVIISLHKSASDKNQEPIFKSQV